MKTIRRLLAWGILWASERGLDATSRVKPASHIPTPVRTTVELRRFDPAVSAAVILSDYGFAQARGWHLAADPEQAGLWQAWANRHWLVTQGVDPDATEAAGKIVKLERRA